MTGVTMNNDKVRIKCIEMRQLARLHEWYNKTDEYHYATGLDESVEIEDIGRKYFEILNSKTEALLGIYTIIDDNLIGALKFRLVREAVWINLLLIEGSFQGRGYGSGAISLFLSHFKLHKGIKEAYLSVAEQNLKGKKFWLRNGFIEIRASGNIQAISPAKCKVIIMKKEL